MKRETREEPENKGRTGIRKQGKDRKTTNKRALGEKKKKNQNFWIRHVNLVRIELRLRSSRPEVFCKKPFLKRDSGICDSLLVLRYFSEEFFLEYL